MNRANISALIAHLETLPATRFNMTRFMGRRDDDGFYRDLAAPAADLFHTCGTAACLPGWTNALFEPDTIFDPFKINAFEVTAREALGLRKEETDELFYPNQLSDVSERTWASITPPEAIKVLNHLLDTQEVDWSIIR